MRRLDWRKLLQWSWGDIPMLLAGLAALLSWASTPELRVETDLLQTTLEAARHSRCSERILAFNASMSAESASGLWRDTHIVPRVRMHCHAAISAAPPHRLHRELLQREKAPDSLPHRLQGWRYQGLQLRATAHSKPLQRLPRLAYMLLMAPSDSPAALERLVAYLQAGDNVFVVHVDAKASQDLHQAAHALTRKHSNVVVLTPASRVTWGAYSLVHVQLRALALLLRWRAAHGATGEREGGLEGRGRAAWDYVINLSGQDVPLMRDGMVKRHLAGQGLSTNWMHAHTGNWSILDGGWVECEDRMYRVVQARRPPRNLYKASGSQWYILSHSFVEFLVSCLYSWETPPVSPDLSHGRGRGQGHDAVSHQVHHVRHMPEEKGGEGVRWAGAEECKVVAAVDTWARHAFIPDEFYFQVAFYLKLPWSTWFLLWLHFAAVVLLGRCLIACLLRRLGAQAAAPHEHHALTLQTTRMLLPHEHALRWCRKADACGVADNVDEFALLLHFLSGSSAVLMYVCT